ncbi:MAG: hypothetical protein ACPGU1_10945 [Myxococcota bacterium]
MRWTRIAIIGIGLMGACGPAHSSHVVATSPETPQSEEHPSVAALLDGQIAAIASGDTHAATRMFADEALFAGPDVDEVGLDEGAKRVAGKRFKRMTSEGFEVQKPPARTIGGEEFEAVRWSVDRFAVNGQYWAVSTLFSGPPPWQIVAQSWDRPIDDQRVISKAQRGEMSPIGNFEDSLIPANDVIIRWIDTKRRRPTDVAIEPPLRGDTFGLGSAGEYVQSDEALLVMQEQQRKLLELGLLEIDPMEGAGRLLRMSRDRAAGVALYHVGIMFETPEGPVTLPMRAISYFLLQPHGPRLVGGHFMATP